MISAYLLKCDLKWVNVYPDISPEGNDESAGNIYQCFFGITIDKV